MNNRIIVICSILLATVYLYATSQLPLLQDVDPLGPKIFPVLLGIGLVLSAVLLMVETTRARGQAQQKEQEPEEVRRQLFLVGGVVCWTLLWFIFLNMLGFILSSVLYLFVFTAYLNRNKWRTNTIFSILFSVATYALFVKALDTVLPKGILFF